MKKLKLLTVTFASVLGITACGGGDIVHIVDQELSNQLPSSEVVIKFWHCLGQKKTENLDKIIEAFNVKYQGHFRLDASVPGGSTYDGLHSAVKTRVASGNVPALTMGYPDSFSEYMGVRLEGSDILRLTNFINDERTINVNVIEKNDQGNWVVKKDGSGNPIKEDMLLGYTKAELDDFVAPYLSEGKGYQFDGYWSLPMYKSTEVMFYNYDYFMGDNPVNEKIFADDDNYWDIIDAKTALDKYYGENHDAYVAKLAELKEYVEANGGVTYEVPQKWDEMLIDTVVDGVITKKSLAKQMIDDRAAHGVDNTNFIPVGYDSDANMVISQMIQRGIPYTSNDNIESKADHLLFNNKQAEDLLNEIYGCITKKYLCTKYSIDQTGSSYTNDKFSRKECVISIGSTGGSDYQVSDNFAVEVAPVPYSGSTPKYVQQGPSICFFDNENANITTGAWLFYKMLADPDMNTALATENSYDPVRISSVESESYAKFIADSKNALLNYVPTVTHLPQIANNQFTTPVFVGSSTCRTQMAELILRMVHNHHSAATALQNAFDAAMNATKK